MTTPELQALYQQGLQQAAQQSQNTDQANYKAGKVAPEFYAGQTVVCVDNKGQEAHLVLGRKYKTNAVNPGGLIIEIDGDIRGYSQTRFKSWTEDTPPPLIHNALDWTTKAPEQETPMLSHIRVIPIYLLITCAVYGYTWNNSCALDPDNSSRTKCSTLLTIVAAGWPLWGPLWLSTKIMDPSIYPSLTMPSGVRLEWEKKEDKP